MTTLLKLTSTAVSITWYSRQGLGVSLQPFSTSHHALLFSLRRLQLFSLTMFFIYLHVVFKEGIGGLDGRVSSGTMARGSPSHSLS